MPSPDTQDESVEPSQAPLATRWERAKAKLRAPVAYARAHPRIAVAVAAAAVLLVAGAVTAWLYLRPVPFDAARSAAAALELLDQGDFDEAKQLAEDIHSRSDEAEPLALASFVLGAVGVKEAEKESPVAKGPLFLLAARYLQDALAREIPDDRSGEAQWLLGRSLYGAGQMAASQSALAEAVAAHPQRAAEIRQLLAEAYLRDCPPKSAEALEQNKLYLADENLTASQRIEGLLQQAEILVSISKPAECLEVLATIPPVTKRLPAASVLRGRALLQEAQALKSKGASATSQRQAGEKLQAALAALREAQESDPARSSTSGRQAPYLAGMCLLESGDVSGALDPLSQLRTADPTTPEYLAAAFQEGNLLRSLKRDAEAAVAYCRALDAVRSTAGFRSPWVSLEQLRVRTLEA